MVRCLTPPGIIQLLLADLGSPPGFGMESTPVVLLLADLGSPPRFGIESTTVADPMLA